MDMFSCLSNATNFRDHKGFKSNFCVPVDLTPWELCGDGWAVPAVTGGEVKMESTGEVAKAGESVEKPLPESAG